MHRPPFLYLDRFLSHFEVVKLYQGKIKWVRMSVLKKKKKKDHNI